MTGALYLLRGGRQALVLEVLETNLDQDVLELFGLAERVKTQERETVMATLRSIRDYRRLHRRRYEAARPLDAKSEAGGRELRERAQKLLDAIE